MGPCLVVFWLVIFITSEAFLSSACVWLCPLSSSPSEENTMAVVVCCVQYLEPFAGVFWHPNGKKVLFRE